MANEKEDWKAECYVDEVREKLLEFADRGWGNIPEMTMVPIVLLNAWVYRPKMADIATTQGWIVSASQGGEGAPASGD